MTGVLVLIGQFVAAYVGGTLLHEATHYIVAWTFNKRPSVGFSKQRQVYVDHDADGELANWAIHIAPFAAGLFIAVTWLRFGGGLAALELWMVIGWVAYAVLGLPNDMRFRVVDDDITA